MAEEKKPAAVNETPKAEKVVKKAPPVATKSKKVQQRDAEESIEAALGKTEGFLYENGKSLLIALGVVVLVVVGFLGYKYLYVESRNDKAGAMIFVAEQQFALDSFAVALHGDGSNAGFLEVVDKYGSTPQGNIAKHYAGVCYLKLGDKDNALAQLEKYNTVKGVPAEVVNAQNFGLRGDIYADKGDYEKAVQFYGKAVDASKNEFTAPTYLKKQGLAYNKLGSTDKALEAFRRIADFYPGSVEARDIAKFIGIGEQK